jgi:WD40 repeat protein
MEGEEILMLSLSFARHPGNVFATCLMAFALIISLFAFAHASPRRPSSRLQSADIQAGNRPDLAWMRGSMRGSVTALAYSPNGEYLATGGDDAVKIWRVLDGQLVQTFFQYNTVYAAMFTPDGSSVIALDARPEISKLNRDDGSQTNIPISPSAGIQCAAISPDGTLIATANYDYSVQVWQTSDGALLHTLTGHTFTVQSLSFSGDSRLLASVSGVGGPPDDTARIWNMQTGAIVCTIPNVSGVGYNSGDVVAFSPMQPGSSHYVLAARSVAGFNVSTNTIVYDIDTSGAFSVIGQIGNQFYQGFDLCFSPDGQRILGGTRGNGGDSVLSYLISDLSLSTMVPGFGSTTGIVFSHDGLNFVTAGAAVDFNGVELNVWKADGSFVKELTPPGSGGPVDTMAISGDGNTIAQTNGGHHGVVVRLASDGRLIGTVPADSPRSFSLIPDGSQVAIKDSNHSFGLYQISNNALVRQFDAGGASTYDCTLSPDGRFLAGRSSTGTIIWNAATGAVVKSGLPNPDACTFSLDSQLFGYVSAGELTILKTADWSVYRTIPQIVGQSFGRHGFSADGKSVAIIADSSALPGEVYVYDLSTGNQKFFIAANATVTAPPAFSPDGQELAVATRAGQVVLHSMLDGSPLRVYDQETADDGPVCWVMYSPDGKFFYYGRSDGTVCCALNPYAQVVFANHGGNTGSATVTVSTFDFAVHPGVTVRLTAKDQPDIVASPITVTGPALLTAVFNLTGAPVGPRNVVVTNTDGSTRTYPNAFTVEEGATPQISVSISAPSFLRLGFNSVWGIAVNNIGNVDATVSDLRIEYSNWFTAQLKGGYVPQSMFVGDHSTSLSIHVPIIPAGGQVIVPIQFYGPPVVGNVHRPYNLWAWVDQNAVRAVEYVGDLTEPLVMRVDDGEGTTVNLMGLLNENGEVTGLAGMQVDANGYGETITFDSNSLPGAIDTADGYHVTIAYSFFGNPPTNPRLPNWGQALHSADIHVTGPNNIRTYVKSQTVALHLRYQSRAQASLTVAR